MMKVERGKRKKGAPSRSSTHVRRFHIRVSDSISTSRPCHNLSTITCSRLYNTLPCATFRSSLADSDPGQAPPSPHTPHPPSSSWPQAQTYVPRPSWRITCLQPLLSMAPGLSHRFMRMMKTHRCCAPATSSVLHTVVHVSPNLYPCRSLV